MPPESFNAIDPPPDVLARIGFNVPAIVVAAGLDAPLAGTYFKVVNRSATASSNGSPTPTSPVQFDRSG